MMGCVNRIGGIAWVGTIQCVVPFRGDLSTGWNSNDLLGDWLVIWVDSTVTDKVV